MNRFGSVVDKIITNIRGLRRPPHVLVIEDDRNDAEIARRALEKAGCDVDVAYSGEEAMGRIFTAERPDNPSYDILFLDLKLPGANGVDILKKLKERAPDTPVVIITSTAYNQLLDAAAKVGYFGLIEKPLVESDVRDILDKHKIATTP